MSEHATNLFSQSQFRWGELGTGIQKHSKGPRLEKEGKVGTPFHLGLALT